MANDLQQLSSEASAANEQSTSFIYMEADQIFRGDSMTLPYTDQVPTDTNNYIGNARTQLKADCSLTS